MSMQNARVFRDQLATDLDVAKAVLDAALRQSRRGEAVTMVAAQRGLEFTADEYASALAEIPQEKLRGTGH